MLHRLFNSCLLGPADIPPSSPEMEVLGVFNPGATATKDGVVLVVRVAERPLERRLGHTALPRWDPASRRVVIDWENDNELAPLDARVVQRKRDGLVRLTYISHLRIIHCADGKKVDSIAGPSFRPETPYEEFGVEDARITRLEDTYYITYVAVSRHGAATGLVSTRDFKSFKRHGLIFCPENKDVVLFPEKIGSAYAALHRPNSGTCFCAPEMWFATSSDLLSWGRHEYVYGGSQAWETGRIGAGAPPLRTPEGWMEIYHGNTRTQETLGIGTYSGGVLLLDLENPGRILGHSGSVFVPEADFEREGFVPNVVFPTGAVQQGDTVLVYYGAADTYTAVAAFSLQDLLHSVAR